MSACRSSLYWTAIMKHLGIFVGGEYYRDPWRCPGIHNPSLALQPHPRSPQERTPSYCGHIFSLTLQHIWSPGVTYKARSPTVTYSCQEAYSTTHVWPIVLKYASGPRYTARTTRWDSGDIGRDQLHQNRHPPTSYSPKPFTNSYTIMYPVTNS